MGLGDYAPLLVYLLSCEEEEKHEDDDIVWGHVCSLGWPLLEALE